MNISPSNQTWIRRLLVPTIIVTILFIPWLGEALFYSKGEPREAIVAVSMIESGDWILPVSYGEDIPYKPPFMAWLIAIFALIFNGGTVNEFISRLPSALAAIALLVATWRIVSSYSTTKNGWRVMLILASMFEFFRAAVACRVDMILTACMVGGMYALFAADKRRIRILWAILLFSGATLTKGPIGTLLPCLALGIYFIIDGRNFFRSFVKLLFIACCSFILPAFWYWLAYRQGGETFGALAWEENIGRLTGTMSYDSHVNPWYYNITSLLAGALPWTIPVVISLFYRRIMENIPFRKIRHGFPLFCVCTFLTVLVFYCIPASKRSVYLLPCYPFLAIGAAYLLGKLAETRLTRVWAIILAVIAIAAPIVLLVITNIQIGSLKVESPGFFGWMVAFVPFLAGCWWLFTRSSRANGLAGSLGLTYLIMLAYNSTYMPAFVNPRSDKAVAATIQDIVPSNGRIETKIDEDRLLRYYSLNFYLNDRLRRSETSDCSLDEVWLITSSPEDSTRATCLSERSADTRRPVYLISPVGKSHPNE